MQALPKNIRRSKTQYNISGVNTEDSKENRCSFEKLCTKCERWFPADEEFFFKDNRHHGGSGLNSWCRTCCDIRQKQYRPDTIKPKCIDPFAELLGLKDRT